MWNVIEHFHSESVLPCKQFTNQNFTQYECHFECLLGKSDEHENELLVIFIWIYSYFCEHLLKNNNSNKNVYTTNWSIIPKFHGDFHSFEAVNSIDSNHHSSNLVHKKRCFDVFMLLALCTMTSVSLLWQFDAISLNNLKSKFLCESRSQS